MDDNATKEAAMLIAKRWKLRKNIHHNKLFEELLKFIKAAELNDTASISYIEQMGLTELHKAVICKQYDEVQRLLLLPLYLETVNEETELGETALYFASYLGSTSLVLLLLEYGALVTTADVVTESELLGAVRADQTLTVSLLLSHGCNVNVMCDGWSPLHVACFKRSPKMIKLLVENRAEVNVVGEWSYSPLNMLFVEFAAQEQYIIQCNDEWLIKRCLEALLTSTQVAVNYWSKCALGNPPAITRALTMLSPTICRILLNNGACADTLLDYSHRAIHDELVVTYSIKSFKLGFGLRDRVERYADCLRLLVSHGIEPSGVGWKSTARILLRQL